MVHHHVAVRAGLLVETDAVVDRERLGYVDLDVRDVLAIPDRFEQTVREPERENVERRLLAEEVVDPEDLALVERSSCNAPFSFTALARSVPNGFSMMMRARSARPDLAQMFDHLGRGRGRDAQVVEPGDVAAQLFFELGRPSWPALRCRPTGST